MNWLKQDLIKFDKIKVGVYHVIAYNGVKFGEFLCKEDGYYDWWVDTGPTKGGYLSAEILHILAAKLDEIKKEWDEQIKNDPKISKNADSGRC